MQTTEKLTLRREEALAEVAPDLYGGPLEDAKLPPFETAIADALLALDDGRDEHRTLVRRLVAGGVRTKADLADAIEELAMCAQYIEQPRARAGSAPIAEILYALACAVEEPDPELLKGLNKVALRGLREGGEIARAHGRHLGVSMRQKSAFSEALLRALERARATSPRIAAPTATSVDVLAGRLLHLFVRFGSVIGLPKRKPIELQRELRTWAKTAPLDEPRTDTVAIRLLEHLGLSGKAAYAVVSGAEDAREWRRRERHE